MIVGASIARPRDTHTVGCDPRAGNARPYNKKFFLQRVKVYYREFAFIKSAGLFSRIGCNVTLQVARHFSAVTDGSALPTARGRGDDGANCDIATENGALTERTPTPPL